MRLAIISNCRQTRSISDLIRASLADDKILPAHARMHKLAGNYVDVWECHIQPNWLLVYEYGAEELILRRTGSHSDLFR